MSEKTIEPKPLPSGYLYKQLTEWLDKATPDVVQRVNSHIRAVTPHSSLLEFHNNGATEKEKYEIYRDVIRAVLQPSTYGHLLKVPGQPPAPAPKPEVRAPAPPEVKPPAPAPAPAAPVTPVQPTPQAADPIAVITQALSQLVTKPAQAPVIANEELIRAIVREELKALKFDQFKLIRDEVEAQVHQTFADGLFVSFTKGEK